MGSGLSNVKTGFGKLMREKGNLDQTWNRDQELPGNVKGVGCNGFRKIILKR